MTDPSNVQIREMTGNDIPAGMRLREIAGWNQTEKDWQRFLALEPRGCFVACERDRVWGTATALSYEKRCGWIGMVLVDPEVRGRGIGKSLLRRAIEYLRRNGTETIKLDATPMGHPLYETLGFVDEYRVERWEGTARALRGAGLQPMTEDDFELIARWDREVFGADRTTLLGCLRQEGPRYCAISRQDAKITGYIFGRAGTRAHYVGPWVAREEAGAAGSLFSGMLSRLSGDPVFVDICCRSKISRSLVEEAGFRFQRELTRMYLGPNRHPGLPELVCGISGPELG